MKPKVYLLFFLFALPATHFAQKINVGVKGGLNIGFIDGRASDDLDGLFNVHGGLYALRDFNSTIGLQVEALMSTLSTVVYHEIFIPGTGPYLNPYQTTLSYLSLPVLMRVKLGRKVVVNAGPQYSILFGKTKRLTNTDTDAFEHGNLSLVFGLQVALGPRMHVYGRYNPGLSSTGYGPNGGYYNNRGKSSLVVQAGIGYTIFK